MIDFREARLRSNDQYHVVAFDHLSPAERKTFGHLTRDPDFYGLLVPPSGSMLTLKSISRDAALLFLTLREPGRVPYLLAKLFLDDNEDQLGQLVLDGIFQIEQDGVFVSGPAAASLIGGTRIKPAPSRVAQLSLDAIHYAFALDGLSPSELAGRLYMFNRVPSTPHTLREFSVDDRLLAYLVNGEPMAEQLEKCWARTVSQDAWLVWRAGEKHCGFKLYVSPTLDGLPAAFAAAVDAFVRTRCSQFKVGRTAFGVLRPDKLVAYFESLEQLQEAAELIRASGAGIAAQGVPFTAAIDPSGLVSWGMDPPRIEQVFAWQEHRSWRQWVAERIAAHTLGARAAAKEPDPAFVLQRLDLDGIDTATWTPNLAIWRGWAGTEDEVA